MTFIMPSVCTQYVIKEIDVVFDVMAYRKLTRMEVLAAVAMYRQTVKKWPPKKGTRITVLSSLR